MLDGPPLPRLKKGCFVAQVGLASCFRDQFPAKVGMASVNPVLAVT
jgi:hypothetical protein